MEIVYAYQIDGQIYNIDEHSEFLSETIFLSEKEALKINSMGDSFKELIFASILGNKLKLDPSSYFYDCFYKYNNQLWLLLEVISKTPYLNKCTSRMISKEKSDKINKIFDAYDSLQIELCELQLKFTMSEENKWSRFDICEGIPFIKSGDSLFKLKEEVEVFYHKNKHLKIDLS